LVSNRGLLEASELTPLGAGADPSLTRQFDKAPQRTRAKLSTNWKAVPSNN
jgi:hypothetical protein